MRIGDIIALPVNLALPKARWQWEHAKVVVLHAGGFVEFEFIAGPKDGSLLAITRDDLDEMLGREGGEGWKKGGGTPC